MTRSLFLSAALIAAAGLSTGCESQAVGQLSGKVTHYYDGLTQTLAQNQTLYGTGVEGLSVLEATDLTAKADWDATVRRGALLLQSHDKPDERTDLLLTQLADLSVADGSRFSTALTEANARAAELTTAYAALLQAAQTLRQNSGALTAYLNDKSSAAALRDVDVAGLARAVSVVRDARQLIRNGTARSTTERAAEDARVEKRIGEARDLLVKLASPASPPHP